MGEHLKEVDKLTLKLLKSNIFSLVVQGDVYYLPPLFFGNGLVDYLKGRPRFLWKNTTN